MIHIVDYGMGNLGSVLNMFRKIGAEAKLTATPDELDRAEKILLPGVGAFDAAMSRIEASGLKEVLNRKALVEKVPVLGICLGMHLLTESSEEGHLPGFGWIRGKTYHFKGRIDEQLRIPHMGWNVAEIERQNALTKGYTGEIRYYFVHAYYVQVESEQDAFMKTTYGVRFDSAIHRDNIFGAQFHPEKSHRFGMKLLENFAAI